MAAISAGKREGVMPSKKVLHNLPLKSLVAFTLSRACCKTAKTRGR